MMVFLKKFNVQYQILVRDINIEILLNVLVVLWFYLFDFCCIFGLDYGVFNEVQDYLQQVCGGGFGFCCVQVKYNLEYIFFCKEGMYELVKYDKKYQCFIKIFKINLYFCIKVYYV